MRKFLFFVLVASMALIAGCKKDNALPTIVVPGVTNVPVTQAVDITFGFTAEAGFSSSSVASTGGTSAIKTDGTADAATGNIVVTFTAGSAIGAGTVTLTIEDNDGNEIMSTATLNIKNGISISNNISTNTTWETGKVYILESRIAVLSGATLTIQPGVIVKGEAGTGSNATALIIARGGKIEAVGTATQPIIFTSLSDEILPGQLASPNLSPDLDGLWGGLIVLGNAPIAAAASPKQIEGIPPSDLNGLYGGTNAADNSGTIKYVSIRHGGANIGEGNEINGLTLGGVGSGTVIENIEIIANQDDGIEWFGGAVNVTNAIVWNAGDDAIDTDQAWSGTLDNFIVINPYDKCFELDGPEGPSAPAAKHIIKNGNVKAGNAIGLVDIDNANDSKDSYLDFLNIYFYNVKKPQTFDGLPKFATYPFTFADFQITLPASTTILDFFLGGSDVYATSVADGANTKGADKTKFAATWSWAKSAVAF